jgi:Tol biopolymer transport system component
MTRTIRFIFLAFCLSVRTPGADVVELFERARALQAGNQNLSEAIRLYAQVVAEAKSQRVLAAQAQYQEGVLFQRLGRRTEARQALQAVIRDFPDQAAVVRLARSRLPANTLPPVTANHAVWTGPEVDESSTPSPDGRFLAFEDWRTGALRLRELATGETRTVTRTGGAGYAFSRDGKKIAYSRYDVSPSITSELRIINVDGTNEHVIYREAQRLPPIVVDWSPDGKYLLACIGQRSILRRLFLVNSQSGELKPLPTTGNIADRALFSSDGAFVIYETVLPGEHLSQIYSVAVDGSQGSAIVKAPANNELLGWSPDGGRVVFLTDRSGAREIWEVPVKSGAAAGAAEMVRREPLPGEAIRMTRRGVLFYVVSTGQSDVFTAEVDPETRTVISPPKSLSQRFVGAKNWPVWSVDGRSILYLFTRAAKPQIVMVGPDGRDRDVFPQLTVLYQVLRAHPDGRSVFVKGQVANGSGGAYRVSLEDGSVQFLGDIIDRPAWSADAQTFFYGIGRDTLFARDAASGQVREVYKHPTAPFAFKNPSTAVSPDGTQLAVLLQGVPPGRNSLATVPVSGGPPRVLFTASGSDPDIATNSPSWTPDGKYILGIRNSAKSAQLWRIRVADGRADPFPLTVNAQVRVLRLNPDGRRIVFSTAQVDQEIWTLENFLPQGGPR